MGDQARVDVATLEDFHRTLADHLAEARAIEQLFHGMPVPKFGTFADAANVGHWYATLHHDHVERLSRLQQALEAARAATADIIHNYTTTEARNTANATQIIGVMKPVTQVLGSTTTEG